MKVQLQVPEEVFDAYSSHADALQARGQTATPEELMASQVANFRHVHPGDRVVVVDSKSRGRLERVLHGGSLLSGVDLAEKVEKLATLKIGEINLDFTPSQWAQLRRYADKNGKSLPEVVEWTVRRMESLFFDHTPPGVA